MKKLITIFVALVIVGILIWFGYKEATNYVAQKVVNKVSRSLTPEEVAKLTNNPELIQEAQAHTLKLDPNHLTLQDKKALVSIVTNDFSAADLKDIAVRIARGNLTQADKQQLVAQYKSKFSPQDIDTLKSLAVKMIDK
ncbi:hypothetical protein PU629_02675 [Pullulanibacillus sp. KACC 23026]|uniref:hypothetical protein n=1 Tax=Pullulanibacillus sp. KACC 23026 TaxID=3028315 RepID=UPI0023B1FD15|nr:hypothetical protein [Pullulanibacillus sp. KACC 23026]WEG13287.1 hypothetical protein PU629_02675 [Pullulanibacillus sp. KACC 23026]